MLAGSSGQQGQAQCGCRGPELQGAREMPGALGDPRATLPKGLGLAWTVGQAMPFGGSR